uniref:Uncharacterized protein n=1 Tax=Anopheles coluzzii TaxID=1518534 RepID=A0A8W7PI24_ANOCL
LHVLQNDESASRRISGRLIEMGSWPLNCTFHIALAKSRCTSARLRKCKVKEEEKATETSVYVSKTKSKQTGQEREKHYRRNHNTVSGTRRNRCYFTLRKQKKK